MSEPKRGWFARLTEGLTKSSKQMGEQIAQVFVAKEPLDQAKLDELIRSTQGAHNALFDLKALEQETLDASRAKYQAMAAGAEARARGHRTPKP